MSNFRFNGQLIAGLDDSVHTGSVLTALMDGAEATSSQIESSLFGVLDVTRLGLPLLTLATVVRWL